MSNKITPTPWTLEEAHGCLTISYNYSPVPEFVVVDYDITTDESCGIFGDPEQDRTNFRAIVTAVNNTYGQSINPEAVKDLKNCLEELLEQFEKVVEPKYTLDYMLIRESKAAIEKAKLI